MLNLMKARIKCECCDKTFDIGNYTKRVKNITTTGYKRTQEQKDKLSKIQIERIKENGSVHGLS